MSGSCGIGAQPTPTGRPRSAGLRVRRSVPSRRLAPAATPRPREAGCRARRGGSWTCPPRSRPRGPGPRPAQRPGKRRAGAIRRPLQADREAPDGEHAQHGTGRAGLAAPRPVARRRGRSGTARPAGRPGPIRLGGPRSAFGRSCRLRSGRRWGSRGSRSSGQPQRSLRRPAPAPGSWARRRTLRHRREAAHPEARLALAPEEPDHDLAVEALRCRRLIKGYSDTHAKGLAEFDRVTGASGQPVLSRNRWILPVAVLGRAGTKRTRRGYL